MNIQEEWENFQMKVELVLFTFMVLTRMVKKLK